MGIRGIDDTWQRYHTHWQYKDVYLDPVPEKVLTELVFVSNHFSMDDDGCRPVSGTIIELMTCMGDYPTYHFSENELTKALAACGFGDFTVRPGEEGRKDRSLILTARKLG